MAVEYLPIDRAAVTLGVDLETILAMLKNGRLPEAVRVGERWLIPFDELPAIATRENLILDVAIEIEDTAANQQIKKKLQAIPEGATAVEELTPSPAGSDRYPSALQVRLVTEIRKREDTEEQVTYLTQTNSVLEEQLTEAHARIEEIRAFIDTERTQRTELRQRFEQLEADRKDLLMSLDWLSRRRFTRRQQVRERLRDLDTEVESA